jgi:ATPase family associated with various cellular activities (AAA)
MSDGRRLVELAADLLRAHGGDRAAKGRLLRNALPLAANVVKPGAGWYVRRGLEFLDEARDQDLERASDETPELDGYAGDFEAFTTRLLNRSYGFYIVTGEPETGKTTLALRLAQRLWLERHFGVVAVGGFHPDDRRKWETDQWVEYAHPASFLKAMRQVERAMVKGRDYPTGIKRRVILIDDAALIAHAGATTFNRALLQAWNAYRHLDWVLIVTARTFKSVGPVCQAADVRFLKRPVWDQLVHERHDALAWWREADEAFRQLRRTPEWQAAPSARQWVYVQAPRLHYSGMLPYGGPIRPGDVAADEWEAVEDLDDDELADDDSDSFVGAANLLDDDESVTTSAQTFPTPRRRR